MVWLAHKSHPSSHYQYTPRVSSAKCDSTIERRQLRRERTPFFVNTAALIESELRPDPGNIWFCNPLMLRSRAIRCAVAPLRRMVENVVYQCISVDRAIGLNA